MRVKFREPPAPRLLALCVYACFSLLFLGLPVLSHPGRTLVGAGRDPEIFVWSFAWWPHAMGHGLNPLVTHDVWAPLGLNLAWVTATPGLALAFAPATLLFGPAASYDLAALAMPALAAWTAFLLCRHLTRSFLPSLAGGYLFGFSSYVLGETLGHLHMTSVFLLPLLALVVLRHVQGELTKRGLVVRLGPLLAAQLLLSTEVFFTATLALCVSGALALALVPGVRRRLRRAVIPMAGSYALCALLTSPFLYYALTDFRPRSINSPTEYPADLANLVIPTDVTWLSNSWTSGKWHAFSGNISEDGAYLGVPALVILAWFAWSRRRSAGARLLVALFLLAVVAELGLTLHIVGREHWRMPWRLVSGLPGFDNVLPGRLSVYVALIAAVAVALWAASAQTRLAVRIALVTAAVGLVLPNPHYRWQVRPSRPSFLSEGLYRACIARGENVLVLPYGAQGDGDLWQAESHFRFRLADAHLTPDFPHSLAYRDEAVALSRGGPVPGSGKVVLAMARAQHADVILDDATTGADWRTYLARLRRSPEVGGVIVDRLTRRRTACGQAAVR